MCHRGLWEPAAASGSSTVFLLHGRLQVWRTEMLRDTGRSKNKNKSAHYLSWKDIEGSGKDEEGYIVTGWQVLLNSLSLFKKKSLEPFSF